MHRRSSDLSLQFGTNCGLRSLPPALVGLRPPTPEGMVLWGAAHPLDAPLRYASSLPRIALRANVVLAHDAERGDGLFYLQSEGFAEGDAGEQVA